MVTAEKKFFQVTGTSVAIDENGGVVNISDISQGDTDITRDGDQLLVRSIELACSFVVADATNLMRLLVVQWMPQGVPALSDVITSTGGPLACLAPYLHDTRYQFRVLYDKRVAVDTYNPIKIIHKRLIRIPIRKIQYVAGTNVGNNKIYAMFISDSAAVSHPTVNYQFKLNFSDS